MGQFWIEIGSNQNPAMFEKANTVSNNDQAQKCISRVGEGDEMSTSSGQVEVEDTEADISKRWKRRKEMVSVKKHGMRTRNGKLREKQDQAKMTNDPRNGDETKIMWNLDDEVAKVIETGVALGFDFNRAEREVEIEVARREIEDQGKLRADNHEAKVVDIPLIGSSFTWTNSRERAAWERLDRFLFLPEFLVWYPSLVQKCLGRSMSDHIAICIRESKVNWGPTSFRFYNWWLEEKKLMQAAVQGELLENGVLVSDPQEIKQGIYNYFKKHYENVAWKRPKIIGLDIKRYFDEERLSLEEEFSMEKVTEAVKSCDVLISKIWKPPNMGDYRPISLVGAMYKVVAKVLANRIKKVIKSIIGETQMAFIKNLQILDSFVIVEEVIHKWRKSEEGGLLVKLDFEKAYDSVDHMFLKDMMEGMGFGSKWRQWIQECISSPSISVLVNGSPTPQFGVERGLRQRDPLSPFLFNIIVESLSTLLTKAVNMGFITGESFGCGGVHVSHLQFADDTMVFLKPMSDYVLNLKRILGVLSCLQGDGIEKRKLHAVDWITVCKSKKNGGLGISRMLNKNDGLLAKLLWRFGNKESSLWRKVVCAKYGVDGKRLLWDWKSLSASTFFVKAIANVIRMGSHSATVFFKVNKTCFISDFGHWQEQNWVWKVELRRPPFDWEKGQWNCFMKCLECVTIRNSVNDTIAWGYSLSSSFSVMSFRKALEDIEYSNVWLDRLLWRGICPPKVEFFTWQLLRGRVFVGDVLRRFGMALDEDSSWYFLVARSFLVREFPINSHIVLRNWAPRGGESLSIMAKRDEGCADGCGRDVGFSLEFLLCVCLLACCLVGYIDDFFRGIKFAGSVSS
ncbi:hypothetical protein Dsin_008486 [Dipteronia sinensis]|uniref:Reverse transcriptase domain-containing protein n=1 Tax=Dipteronia sinensis TaxID=43782 RepID=A0AAE0ANT4_9ROSI|nr:hypothetical protein Dsin_008486 [Dipteronia sinensis]